MKRFVDEVNQCNRICDTTIYSILLIKYRFICIITVTKVFDTTNPNEDPRANIVLFALSL